MSIEEYRKEAGSKEEFLVCTKLLPAIRSEYSSRFDLLEIPETLRADESAGPYGTYFFRHYGNQTYNDRWSEQPGELAGGRALGLELSSEMPRLISDFRKIDIDWVLQHPVGEAIGKASFDLTTWLGSFRSAAGGLGLLETELRQAEELISAGFESNERIISNGDFYPRNLIKFDQKFAVIDWGYWPGSRACFIDHVANVAAFSYIHMWDNKPWQEEFAAHIVAIGVTPGDLQKGILIKAFEQAAGWKGHPTLWPPQVSLFRRTLQNGLS